MTPRLQQAVLEHVAEADYRAAGAVPNVPGVSLSPARVGRLVQAEGERLAEDLFGVDAALAAGREQKENPAELLVMSGDGSRYRTNEADQRKQDRPRRKAQRGAGETSELSAEERDRGWRENKLAVVIRAKPGRILPDGEYIPPEELLKTYVATTGSIKELERLLSIEAERRGWLRALFAIWISDHGHGLPAMVERLFGRRLAQIITDFFHACERLSECARLLRGEGPQADRPRQRLFHGLKDRLWRGRVERVIEVLVEEAEKLAPRPEHLTALADRPEVQKLWEHIFYFEKHRGTMDYPRYRERGWPISSAMIESACGQFGERMKHNRMRWTRRTADALHHIKAAILSQDNRWASRWPEPIPVLELPVAA